jgi:hypothetical protein
MDLYNIDILKAKSNKPFENVLWIRSKDKKIVDSSLADSGWTFEVIPEQ